MITGTWFFDEKYNCWCLEDVPYTERPTSPRYQQLSIFVPAPYMSAPGVVDEQGRFGPYTSRTVPVVFENNSAGYMQMPHTWLGGPRCYAEQYLERGFVYVTCGCRGRESRDAEGRLTGKSPAALVDLKTALRFLRHHRAQLPGDWERVVSAGWSAGGAMSTLLAVSGDNAVFDAYLKENGAYMDESDAVWAAQITPFKEALSALLAKRYAEYFSSLGLRAPGSGETLSIEDGRGGSAPACTSGRSASASSW